MAGIDRPYPYLKAHGSIAMPPPPGDRRHYTSRSTAVSCEIAIGGGIGNELTTRKARPIPHVPGESGELVAVIPLRAEQRQAITAALLAASEEPIVETSWPRARRRKETNQ